MNTPNRVELYNSQSTETLKKMKARYEFEPQTKAIVDSINYILDCRENDKEVKSCMETCDGSCKDKCVNRK